MKLTDLEGRAGEILSQYERPKAAMLPLLSLPAVPVAACCGPVWSGLAKPFHRRRSMQQRQLP